MPNYEVVYITDPQLDTEQNDAILERLRQVLSDKGANVQNVDLWGKRKLAYEVAGHREGNYTVLAFEGSPEASEELERIMRINDGIIRHLLVRREEC